MNQTDKIVGTINLEEFMQRDKKSRMTFWFPLVSHLEFVPKTIEIKLTNKMMDEGDILSGIKPDMDKIRSAIDVIGYPAFIRTDISSSKFSFKKSCFITRESDLTRHLYELIVSDLSIDIIGMIPEALYIREYIEPEYIFKAFLNLPIARERRYFIKDGKVQCHHPYWVEDAIRFYHDFGKQNVEPKNWKKKLREINKETDDEILILSGMCNEVIQCGFKNGYWSVDFMKGKNGKWYLIDMAEGLRSWHPECQFNQENSNE